MPEHTYTAQSLDRALSRVKRELGADAVILSSRQLAGGGAFEVRALAAEDATDFQQPVPASKNASLLERLLIRNGLDPQIARLFAVSAPGQPRTLREATEGLARSLAQFGLVGAAVGRESRFEYERAEILERQRCELLNKCWVRGWSIACRCRSCGGGAAAPLCCGRFCGTGKHGLVGCLHGCQRSCRFLGSSLKIVLIEAVGIREARLRNQFFELLY